MWRLFHPHHPNPSPISVDLNLSCTLEPPEEPYKISGLHPGLIEIEFLMVGPRLWHFFEAPSLIPESSQAWKRRLSIQSVNQPAAAVHSQLSPLHTAHGLAAGGALPSAWWQQQSLPLLFSNRSYLCIFISSDFTRFRGLKEDFRKIL